MKVMHAFFLDLVPENGQDKEKKRKRGRGKGSNVSEAITLI